MKRVLPLLMVIMIFVGGCTQTKTSQTNSLDKQEESVEALESLEESEKYKTLLSPNNRLRIVRKPEVADYSYINPGKLMELPKYDDQWQVDLRSSDLTNLDLRENFEDLIHADFDSKTQWPGELPDGFNPEMIMELGKNPGLGLRELHQKGITRKGVGIAIIDQSLLVDHVEYKEQLKMYEEIHCYDERASMHGPAVASIAVGKTVGVAPEQTFIILLKPMGSTKNKGNSNRI